MLIIEIDLNETCIRSINGCQLDNMKTFHNYLPISLISPTHLHGYEKENKHVSFHN
jgi:hypothetical protein